MAFAIGAGLRIVAWWTRGAFWIDEAALASNIVDRKWFEVGRPFIHQQLAPYGFVLVEKVLSAASISEHCLRAYSLATGLLLLPAMVWLARPLFGWQAGLFALLLAGCTRLLIHHSSELKPYGGDACIATVLLVALAYASRHGRQRPAALLPLMAAGVLAPWFSLPSLFVLAAAGIGLCVEGAGRRAPIRYWSILLAGGAAWLVSFALQYFFFLRMAAADADSLQLYWSIEDGFAPQPLWRWQSLRWLIAKTFYLFTLFIAPGEFGLRYLMVLIWGFGLALAWRKSRALAIGLAAPLACFFVATITRSYVMADRLVLFAAPCTIVPFAGALAALASVRPRVTRPAAAWIVVGLALLNVAPVVQRLGGPPAPSGIRPALAYLQREARPGDVLYVEELSYWVTAYYAKRIGLHLPYVVGESQEDVLARTDNPLRTLAGSGRVWVVLPIEWPRPPQRDTFLRAERLLKERLSAYGRPIRRLDALDIHLYLYDLSAPPMAASPSQHRDWRDWPWL